MNRLSRKSWTWFTDADNGWFRYNLYDLMLALIVVAAFMLLIGCKQPEVRYITKPCPPPPVVGKPILPIERWDSTWSDKETLKALWASLALQVGYSKALEELLQEYRTAKP